MKLGTLYKNALETAIAGTAKVHDYADDFETIWEKNAQGAPALLDECTNGHDILVIVWDGRPPNSQFTDISGPTEKLLVQHLTPLDWALTFSTRVLENEQMKNRAHFSIHIVDLTGNRFEDAWAMRMRHQLLADMPWVRLYAPLILAGGVGVEAHLATHAPVLSFAGAGESLPVLLVKNAGTGWRINSRTRAKHLADNALQGRRWRCLRDLATQWAASLTQSNDHHNVNNVIGPDILARAQHGREGLPGAFLTRLAWSRHALDRCGNWKSWGARQVTKNLFDRPLSVFVIDDQLQQGWGRFACRLLDGEQFDENCVPNNSEFVKLNQGNRPDQKVKVYGCLGSQPLIDFLEGTRFDRRNFIQQIYADKHADPQPQLVFLDLRLYAEAKEARAQAEKLLKIVNERAQGGLAWPEIKKDEIERIAAWCEGEDKDARIAEVEALLLLPRLLALALPLTPIILFSSTGRAWIRGSLKDYRNIFTGFEKPRVLSEPELVNASIAALREELDKAVGMMRLRLQLAHAQEAVAKANLTRPPRNDGLSTHHIEIYADETRSLEEGITSGLAVCVYPSRNRADVLQTKLWAEHRGAGVVWAKNPDAGVPRLAKGAEISKNLDECENQVQQLAELLNENDVDLGPDKRQLWSVVATRMPAVLSPEKRRVSLAEFPDGRLDEALRFNLEFTLYVLIPYFSTAKNSTFGGTVDIYLPTRKVPYGPTDQEFAKNLCVAFDLGAVKPGRDKKTQEIQYLVPTASFSRDESLGTAFPLIRGWLHEWRKTSPVSPEQITKIKIEELSGEGGISCSEAHEQRLFHDIADWACAASGKKRLDNNTKSWVWPLNEELKHRNLFLRWFVSTDGKRNGYGGDYWFKTDTENALILMRALKASFGGTFGDSSENDALRLMLRNSYVETCDNRLINSEFCAQQRLILWMLRRELDFAEGWGLHSLLAADTGHPGKSALGLSAYGSEETTEQSRVGDQPLAETPAGEEQSEAPAGHVEVDESTNSGQAGALLEVLDEEKPPQALKEEQFPQILGEADIQSRFSGCGQYEVVKLTKFGDIFFKPFGDQESKGTHWTHDQEMAYNLNAEGWFRPVVVYGMEVYSGPTDDPVADIYVAATSREEKSLRVVAAKLADGRWKLVRHRLNN